MPQPDINVVILAVGGPTALGVGPPRRRHRFGVVILAVGGPTALVAVEVASVSPTLDGCDPRRRRTDGAGHLGSTRVDDCETVVILAVGGPTALGQASPVDQAAALQVVILAVGGPTALADRPLSTRSWARVVILAVGGPTALASQGYPPGRRATVVILAVGGPTALGCGSPRCYRVARSVVILAVGGPTALAAMAPGLRQSRRYLL